jgi:lipid-A-disaccharide synthase
MNILVVAGDPSGDLHASHLIRHLRKGGGRVSAVGGPLMSHEADEFLEDLASRGVTGFWEPVGKLGFLLRLLLRLRRMLKEGRFDSVVCVDYYGFNRRVLGLAKAARVPAFYYISPQVWASRPSRVAVLKRLVRKMLVIFPFEEKLYQEAGLPCRFVGHPLLDLVPKPVERPLAGRPPLIGLLPGSRASEIAKHLPLLLKAFAILSRNLPGARALVFAAQGRPDSAYAAAAGQDNVELVRESDYRLRAGLDLALSSSGTATLENALLGLPMVVLYKLSWPTYLVARAIVRVPYISMANILAGRRLVPELIQGAATPEGVAAEAEALLKDLARYGSLRRELGKLRASLGEPGAAERAAAEILSSL